MRRAASRYKQSAMSGRSGGIVASHGPGVRLRPMAIGDVLDETFRLYRRHFVSFVLTIAVVAVPAALLGLIVPVLFGLNPGSANVVGLPPERIIALVIVVLILVLAWLVFYLLATIASVRLASDAILGRPVDVRAAYRDAGRHSGAIALSSLLSSLAVGLLFMTCLGIPFAVYLWASWSVVMPAIVVERLSGPAGLRRSWDLVRGHRWRLIVVFLLMGLITWLLVSVPGGIVSVLLVPVIVLAEDNPALLAAANVISTLVNVAGQALFGGLWFITTTIVYYDLLVRKEAFDLQQRAASLPEPSPPASFAEP